MIFDAASIIDGVAVNTQLAADVRDALRAYLDAITLAEPLQVALWKSSGITLTQLSVLRQLRAGPGPAGQLGRTIGLSPASTTHLLDRLEERGLVSRQRCTDDRRTVKVHLTEEGQRVLGESRLLLGSHLHRAVEAMTPDERRGLAAALDKLIDHAHRLAGEASEPTEGPTA
jgi:DNA-binding MarR family transcriptional regulator